MIEPERAEANLRSYLQILRRRFLWIVVVTLLSLSLAAAFISLQKKQFSATAQLLVQPATASLPISGTPQTISPTDVLTELQLLTSAPVKAQAARRLGYQPTVSESEAGQTNVIQVTGTGQTAVSAATVANVYSRVFVAYQRANAISALTAAEQQYQTQIKTLDIEIQTLSNSPTGATSPTVSALTSQVTILKEELAQLQVAGAETPGGVEVVSLAIPPTSPSSPRPVVDGAIGLIVGVLLGIVAALVVDYFDDKVYRRDQAEELSGGTPVLAAIPKISTWAKRGHGDLITSKDSMSHASESYRSLRTSLEFAGNDQQLKTILVTSPAGSEGKTATVANLGVVLANAGKRVVVVGCDLRRPRLGQFFGMAESPGFTSVLLGRDDLTSAVRTVSEVPGVAVLPAGPIPPNPADLLGSDKAEQLFRLLGHDFDVVLIDGPPVLPVTDALVVSRYADAVVMVIAAGQTTGPQVERASELLRQAGARTVGLVLNKSVPRWGDRTEYGYKYAYKYRYRSRYAPDGTSSPVQTGNGHLPVESHVAGPDAPLPQETL